MIQATKLIQAAPKYLGTPYSTMDCQAYIERVMADAGIRKNLAGSNTWYRFALNHGWVGTPEACKQTYGRIPKGAFLFILTEDGKEPTKYQGDGIGNASHIGIYTGQSQDQMLEQAFLAQGISSAAERKTLVIKAGHGSGAINSSSTWGCVATSKFSGKSISGGWNRVWLWTDEIDYGTNSDSSGGNTPMATATVVLPAGASGTTVNLRKGTSTSTPIIEKVPVGATVQITNDLGPWCAIQYKGTDGYMMSNYLEYAGQGGESDSGITDEDRQKIELALQRIESEVDVIRSVLGRG